ncbi:hypothetical protein NPIL_463271 [Nephila pilipes]|uniref:Uncharacterized protein n=1 Tax=Nephila pilipes TaxID=299642 RepID=A0A8X6TK48_NEPPI|nr:hypothetical protein NPIL_463271 [Nephila pilipes]
MLFATSRSNVLFIFGCLGSSSSALFTALNRSYRLSCVTYKISSTPTPGAWFLPLSHTIFLVRCLVTNGLNHLQLKQTVSVDLSNLVFERFSSLIRMGRDDSGRCLRE